MKQIKKGIAYFLSMLVLLTSVSTGILGVSEGIELVGVDTTFFANNINEIFLSDPENVIALSHAGEDITDDFFQTARECFQHEAGDEFYTFCVENVGTIKRFDDSVQMGARGMDGTQLHSETIYKYCRWDGGVEPSEFYPGISQLNNNGYISLRVSCSFTFNTSTGAVTSVSKPTHTPVSASGFREELQDIQIMNDTYSHGNLGGTSCSVTYTFRPSAWFFVAADSPQAKLSYHSESATMTVSAR